jgi:tripartite-type tricarboxylate transporter receptor subunit TctC
MTNRRTIQNAVASAAVAVAWLSAASAQAQDFYAGKTISILVSSDAGGGYDTYSRLLAQYLPKHIPGKPTVVVQNMPGGGGLRVAQQVYSVIEKDGTKIGNIRASNVLDSILNIRGGDIDPTKYAWIGDMASDTDICSFWHTSGVKSIEDLKNKEILIGGSGKGGQNYSFPMSINSILGTKMKIILGYKGMADRILALERGELQGNCGMNASSLMALHPDLIANGKLVPVLQSGLTAHPSFKNVPLTQSFATDERQKRLLTTIYAQMDIARTFAFPPGTPKDRVEIMRKAFMAALADPGLIADAERQKLDLNARSGEEVAKIVADMADISEDMKKDARAALGE